MSRSRTVLALAGIVPFLGACETMSRFSGMGSPQPQPIQVGAPAAPLPEPGLAAPAPADDPVAAAPLPPVQAQKLPAPGAALPPAEEDDGPLIAPGAAVPPAVDGGTPTVPSGELRPPKPTDVAVADDVAAPQPRPPKPAAPPTNSRVVGSWSVAEQNGGSCRLSLSSAPFVDLSRASTSGCSPALAKVNAWKLEGGEIVLFETGGAVAARLRGGGSSFSGAAVKTGAPVSISR